MRMKAIVYNKAIMTPKPEKILIIESEASFGARLADTLRADGYSQVSLYADETTGLKALYDDIPNIVLLGVSLPDNQSYDIIAKKHAEPMLAKIPLIFMSTQGMPINMRDIPTDSVTEFMVSLHPDPAEIVAKVDQHLGHEAPVAPVVVAPAGDKKKLLWVEDDKLIGSILAKKLVASDFDLFHAKNGEEAITALKELTPDVIALDLMLPGMSGFDILQAIKQEERLKSIPVIILSNLSKQSDIERAKTLGAQKFLVKATVSLDQIVEEVRGLSSK